MSDSFATPWTVACEAPLFRGFPQARMLEWVAISFSRRSLQPWDGTCISCIGRWILYHGATRAERALGLPICKIGPRILSSLYCWEAQDVDSCPPREPIIIDSQALATGCSGRGFLRSPCLRASISLLCVSETGRGPFAVSSYPAFTLCLPGFSLPSEFACGQAAT